MAKGVMKLPDDLLVKLSKLGTKSDEIAEKALEAAGEIALRNVKSKLSSVVGNGTKYDSRTTGELESSLGLTDVKVDKNGNHNIKVGFSEPRSDGESNAKIATILEYGKSCQPAKPFLAPAKSASKQACKNAMQQVLESEVGKL